MPAKVRINTSPVADRYASTHARILEFSAGTDGAGGLISFDFNADGTIRVHVYRQEKTVVSFDRPNRAARSAAQIAHITEHQSAFRSVLGDYPIAVYLADCVHDEWDVYQRVCAELGIEPKPEICHPDPED